MFLTRVIYANGNEYKTIDEIYNLIDPPMDRSEFDKQMMRLKDLHWLDEHNLHQKIKINNIGETNLINLDRQEERERLRLDSLKPAKKPKIQTVKTILWIYTKPLGKLLVKYITEIIIAIIATIVAAYLIVKYKIPH